MTNWTVWKAEKNYQRLFWAGAFNGLGNRFCQVATLALLYQITGSGVTIGLLFAVRMAPFLLLAPIGGMLADRYPKQRLLISIDILRIPFAVAPIMVQGPEDLWIIFVSAFCLSAGEAIYSPTRMASIPAIVKRGDRLLYVNAIEQIMVGAVLVVGSSTGGVISYIFGLNVPFLLDGLTFLLSALFLLRMTIPASAENNNQQKHLPTKQGLSIRKIIMGSSALLVFVIIELTMPLANGIDNVLMSVYALDVFSMGDLGVGFIYACLGLGFIASSFFSNMLKRKLVVLVIIFIALEGSGHILLSAVPTFFLALLTVLFITFAGGISDICLSTLTMKIVPKSKQGAFFGITQMISNTALGLSMGVGGLLLEVFNPRTLSLLIGLTYIFFMIIYAYLFTKIDLKKEKRKLLSNLRKSA